MADSTLNRFNASGTTAERTAFVPDPPTPSSGPDFGYFWFDTDDGLVYSWDGSAWQAPAGTGTVTNTGTLTASQLIQGNGGTDVSTISNTAATALLDAMVGDSGSGGTKGMAPAPAAGDAAAGKFLKADGTWTAPSGGGGNSIDSTAFGSEPGTPSTGDLDLYSNSFYVSRYNGSAWTPWGPIFPLTDPALAAPTTWVNQGTATVSTTNGGVFIEDATGGSANIRARVKTAPATPYTISTAWIPRLTGASGEFSGLAIGWRESSSGKIVTCCARANNGGWQFIIDKWTNATTWSGGAYTSTGFMSLASLLWLRIKDDGTTRYCQWSADGQNWSTVHSVGRTDFLTADQVFYSVHINTNPAGGTLLSWKEE